jgi:hypothetical protein
MLVTVPIILVQAVGYCSIILDQAVGYCSHYFTVRMILDQVVGYCSSDFGSGC